MSSEVWNIAQQTNAHDMYDSFGYKIGESNLKTQLNALEKITSMCKDMISAFYELEDDQNQYSIEIENLENEYGTVKGDLNSQINKLIAEIKGLEVKEQNGTITEEEQKELNDKKAQLENLFKTSDEQCANTKTEINKKKEQVSSKYLEKQNIALDYGQCAIEKGNPFAEMDVEVDMKDKDLYLNISRVGFFWHTNHAKKNCEVHRN